MPLSASFPDVPPMPRRNTPAPYESNIPTADVPSVRRPIPSSTPFIDEPLPTFNSHLMPSLLGYEAKLFNCQCSPKCIEFVKPRDHQELTWCGSSNQPLRSLVVASGPTAGKHMKSKYADYDVDCRVAYEFNSIGFYNELLSELDNNYSALLHANERSQAFLHQARVKNPSIDLSKPRVYQPYYPTKHLNQSYVAPKPLKDARSVAATVLAPSIAGIESSSLRNRKPLAMEEIEEELKRQAKIISDAATSGALIPSHLRDRGKTYSHPPPTVSASHHHVGAAGFNPQSNTARLKVEREKFAEEMKQQLLGKMSIHKQRSGSDESESAGSDRSN